MKKWFLLSISTMATAAFIGCGSNNSSSDGGAYTCTLDQYGRCQESGINPNEARTFTGNLKISDTDFYKNALGVCENQTDYSLTDRKCSNWTKGTAYVSLTTKGTETSYGELVISQWAPSQDFSQGNAWGNALAGSLGIPTNFRLYTGQFVKPQSLNTIMSTSISSGNSNQGIDISVTRSVRSESEGIRLRVKSGKLYDNNLEAELEFNGKKVGTVTLKNTSSYNYGSSSYNNNNSYNNYNNYYNSGSSYNYQCSYYYTDQYGNTRCY